MSTTHQDQREEQLAADTKKVHDLSVYLREQIADHDHRIQATALLSAYLQVAIANPCCADSCFEQIGKAAFLLAKHLDARQAQGKSIH